jgi:hypothetical protein
MNNLISNQVLIGNMAAESMVLFTQTILATDIEFEPNLFVSLEIGAIYSLYAIREANGQLLHKEKDMETNSISRAKHKELYYYDYNISNLLKEYINKRSKSWLDRYIHEKQRVSDFLKININSEPNI